MTGGRILVVDDQSSARAGLQKLLRQAGYAADAVSTGASALARAAAWSPDAVVTDLIMPGMDGMTLCSKLHEIDRSIPVIIVTAYGNVSSAVAAMRAGAADYLMKPIEFDALMIAIERSKAHRALLTETENLRRQLRERELEGLPGLIGSSPPMQRIYRLAHQVAPSRATVLITGESGTGKSELARAIHRLSPRADAPWVQLECAAVPESLLESEMFGHEKGSFTGADKQRIGRFEQANGGTLFLDEIGDLSPQVQTRLLRILQERAFERVGGNETIVVDVRVIAATHRDLTAAIRDGRFREDLFYRLNVIHLEMPPLRARGNDIVTLASAFLRRFADENLKAIEQFSSDAQAKLVAGRWPGNVRELENAIERAVVLSDGPQIAAADLLTDDPGSGGGSVTVPGATLAEIERWAILSTLEATNGSTAKTAQMLDVSVRTIQYRLLAYGDPVASRT